MIPRRKETFYRAPAKAESFSLIHEYACMHASVSLFDISANVPMKISSGPRACKSNVRHPRIVPPSGATPREASVIHLPAK